MRWKSKNNPQCENDRLAFYSLILFILAGLHRNINQLFDRIRFSFFVCFFEETINSINLTWNFEFGLKVKTKKTESNVT